MTSLSESVERTFLLTDVAGSTALHRRFPGDMLAAMDLHDQILQAAIRRHGGDPFKNTGDGLYALFSHPRDAVLALIAAWRDMREARWGPTGRLLIRAGIHTGLARPRGSDFFGPALPMVSRLAGAAHAEQILLSAVSVERLQADGPLQHGVELLDVGEHHFKGTEPIRVFQVCAPELPRSFPPIGGKRETADGNLPARLSSFVGRDAELAELVEMTQDSRLLTLIGPGGIGKTRLAIEFARSLEASFPDGAWFVDLSALERGADVWPAIASALLVEPLPGMQLRSQVLERLQDARAILLMDNCEHVLDSISEAVVALGTHCPTLFLVNTSRRMLGVDGEALFEVTALGQGLQEPPAQSAAVRLFVARARLADHRFAPRPDELRTIHRICANLEFMPLAIEIAAGHVRRLSIEEIASGVADPLDLGATRVQRRAGRQQTLRHTLQWSYELLDPSSRRILQRLAVFSGPFHEEQALALCADDFASEAEVLRGIDELVESSLLARDPHTHRLLRMLQTVQAFGRHQLDEAGQLQDIEQRHGLVFAARCRELAAQVASEKEAKGIHAIFDEIANLRSAFERALTRDLVLAADIAAALFLFNYSQRGAETARWYQLIMAKPGADALELAPLLLAGAAVHAFHSDGDSRAADDYIHRGLRAEAAGRRSSQGWLASVEGQILQWSNDTAKCLQALKIGAEQARAAGNLACEITSLSMAAYVKARTGDHVGADEVARQVTRLGQVATQPTLLGYVHYARGRVLSFHDPLKAIDEYQISVEWAKMAGNLLGAQRVQHFIAELQAAAAPPVAALGIHMRALADIPTHGATFYAWSTIKSALVPLARLKADEAVATLVGALRVSPVEPGKSARAPIEACKTRLGAAAFDAAAARGARFDLATARIYLAEQAGAVIAAAERATSSQEHPEETLR